MNVLVTGATGFIGIHLCRELARHGHQVTALVRSTSNCQSLEGQGIRFLYGDLNSPFSIPADDDYRQVFHLAGLTKSLQTQQLHQINALGTRNLLRSIQECPQPPTTVIVSSLAAVGPSGDIPHVESADARPVSNYGRSKREAEVMAEPFADRIPLTIVRPPIVFGEGDRGTLPIFQTIARLGIHTIPGTRPKYYSVIHVTDLVRFLIQVANEGEHLPSGSIPHPPGQGYYFVNGSDPIRFGHFGLMIGKAMGRKRTLRVPVPHPLVWTLGAATQWTGWLRGSAAAMSIDKAREATAGSWTCSREKAERQLGYLVPVPLTERIEQTVAWYREHRWL